MIDRLLVTSEAKDIDELTLDINRLQPDVIVLLGNMPSLRAEMLTLMMMTSSLMQIIVINENNNWLTIYRKQDFLLACATDLFDVINSG